jgi:cytochrome P450
VRHDTRRGIALEVYHMVMATTAIVGNAAASLLVALAAHPHVWAKARAEVTARLHPTEPLTVAALDRLVYGRAVVDESRRVGHHVAAMLGRVVHPFNATLPPTAAGGGAKHVQVPAGATVVGAFDETSHLPSEWSHPSAFDPERYSRGEPASGMDAAFMPHGPLRGRHVCPGIDFTTYTLLTVLAQAARHGCEWALPGGVAPRQRLSLFNPEPAGGAATVGWRCTGFATAGSSSSGGGGGGGGDEAAGGGEL